MIKSNLRKYMFGLGLLLLAACGGSEGGSSVDFKTASVTLNISNPGVADMIESEVWDTSVTPNVLTSYSLGAPLTVDANFTITANSSSSSTTISAFQVETVDVNYSCISSTACPAIGPYHYTLGSSSATGSTSISPNPVVTVVPAEFISTNQAFYLAGNVSQ